MFKINSSFFDKLATMNFSVVARNFPPLTYQAFVSFSFELIITNWSITIPLIFVNVSDNVSRFSLSHFFHFLILFFLLKVTLFIVSLPNICFIFIINHINQSLLILLFSALFLKHLIIKFNLSFIWIVLIRFCAAVVISFRMEYYTNAFIKISMLHYF